MVAGAGLRAIRRLPQLEQLEAERFDLRDDAEHGGTVLEPAREHGVAAFDVRHHRGEGGEGGGSEPAFDADRVQARRRGHSITVPAQRVDQDPYSCSRRSARTMSTIAGTVSTRAQSRWSSQASETQLIGCAPAWTTRSSAARCASTEVPPIASTTG